MITSDGRSTIEAEMESMHFTVMDTDDKRLKLDCRDHSLPDGSDTTEYNYPPDMPLSRITRWFARIFSPLQA